MHYLCYVVHDAIPMFKKYIYCQIIFFFSLISLCYGQAEINFEESSHDFGQIEEGTVAVHEFTFINSGDQPLIISTVKASCGCTTPFWTKEPILPGKKGKITASYNSRNRPGGFNKSITVTSNARHSSKMVYIKGMAVKPEGLQPLFTAEQLEKSPKIEIDNKNLQLGKVQVGKGQKFILNIQNDGESPLHLKGIHASCQCLRLHQGKSIVIDPHAKGELALDFLPSKLGAFSHKAKVVSNDLIQPNYEITITGQVVVPQNNASIIKETPARITF